ncbi:acyl-CoA dehydrogenase family protein [Rhizobium mongolense]|uniref:acyl-CoA dehydrogenase family protein n=1 Tax=Rhizobium mongolense TaxID=57676 RepID=UPI001428C891|nr:acyl-CoA dehydrogenase family protein [Rhizobium mongolense]
MVANGYALRDAEDEFPLVNPTLGAGAVRIIEEQSDIALAQIGIAMVRVEPAARMRPDVLRSAIAVATARLGLLARALDMAFQHLEGRQSFGQKTLHHQLVKTRFAYANNLIVRLLEEIRLVEELTQPHDLEGMHLAISEEFAQVSKLMGGHGYLISGFSTLEYLSSLIASIYAEPAFSPSLTNPASRNHTTHCDRIGDEP